jgi:hypothetical protein
VFLSFGWGVTVSGGLLGGAVEQIGAEFVAEVFTAGLSS